MSQLEILKLWSNANVFSAYDTLRSKISKSLLYFYTSTGMIIFINCWHFIKLKTTIIAFVPIGDNIDVNHFFVSMTSAFFIIHWQRWIVSIFSTGKYWYFNINTINTVRQGDLHFSLKKLFSFYYFLCSSCCQPPKMAMVESLQYQCFRLLYHRNTRRSHPSRRLLCATGLLCSVFMKMTNLLVFRQDHLNHCYQCGAHMNFFLIGFWHRTWINVH